MNEQSQRFTKFQPLGRLRMECCRRFAAYGEFITTVLRADARSYLLSGLSPLKTLGAGGSLRFGRSRDFPHAYNKGGRRGKRRTRASE
jgi:hypothetical protein